LVTIEKVMFSLLLKPLISSGNNYLKIAMVVSISRNKFGTFGHQLKIGMLLIIKPIMKLIG